MSSKRVLKQNQRGKPKAKKRKPAAIDIGNDEEKVSLKSGKYVKRNKKKKHSKKEENETQPKEKSFYEWLLFKKDKNIPFFTFVGAIATCFLTALFYVADNNWAFIIAGISGMSISIYGFRHFGTIMEFKGGVDEFARENIRLHGERKKLNTQIDELKKANDTLSKTEHRIRDANLRNKENVMKLAELRDKMETYGKQNAEALISLSHKTAQIGGKWRDQLLKRERSLLHKIYDQYERKGSCKGMTEKDFQGFAQTLPTGYWDRFQRLGTFNHMSTDGKVIDFDDFRCALDLFAEMETDDVDIQFQIQKTPLPKSSRPGHTPLESMHLVQKGMTIPENDMINEKTSLISSYSIGLPAASNMSNEPSISLSNVFDDVNDDEKMPDFLRMVVVTETKRHRRQSTRRLGKNHTKRGSQLYGSKTHLLTPSELSFSPSNDDDEYSKAVSAAFKRLGGRLKTLDEE